MGWTIVSGNTLISSPAKPYFKSCNSIYHICLKQTPNINTKSQHAKISKCMGDAEEPIIDNFYQIGNIQFRVCSFKCESIEIYRSITYQPKLTLILLGDKCPRVPMAHQQTRMPSGKNKLE